MEEREAKREKELRKGGRKEESSIVAGTGEKEGRKELRKKGTGEKEGSERNERNRWKSEKWQKVMGGRKRRNKWEKGKGKKMEERKEMRGTDGRRTREKGTRERNGRK